MKHPEYREGFTAGYEAAQEDAKPKRFVKARAMFIDSSLGCFVVIRWPKDKETVFGATTMQSRHHWYDTEPNARKNAIAWLGRMRRGLRKIGIEVGRLET